MSEQGIQEGTEHATLRGPCVEDQRGRCVVTYPYHLGWHRIQLQREVFSPRVLSLVMSFEGTMVLNTEMSSMNSILTYCRCSFLSRCERAVWSAIEIA